jgi:hypothetical protein
MQYHQGLDYKLYKIYIWGGLPILVIYLFIAMVVFEVHIRLGSKGFLALLLPIMIWIAGIFLYWWWVFLIKDRMELDEKIQIQEGDIPGIKSLRNWSTLHQAMAISGGNIEELKKNYTKAKLPLLIWYGTSNLLALWIFCPITLGSLGILKGFGLGTWLAGVFVLIVVMLVGTPLLLWIGSKTAGKAYLASLGLEITEVPRLKPDVISGIGGSQQLIPDGTDIIEGERLGRLVHIETIGKHSLTVLQANSPEFRVSSEAGKLIPEKGAPDRVVAALKSLRKAKRWQGIQILSDHQGIGIQRHSKGTNMWLYDLWLAEYLLDKISPG